MVTADYEIAIDGELPIHFAAQFAPAQVSVADGRTILSVRAVDQAGLHGILNRVADLGLTLLEVRQPSPTSERLHP